MILSAMLSGYCHLLCSSYIGHDIGIPYPIPTPFFELICFLKSKTFATHGYGSLWYCGSIIPSHRICIDIIWYGGVCPITLPMQFIQMQFSNAIHYCTALYSCKWHLQLHCAYFLRLIKIDLHILITSSSKFIYMKAPNEYHRDRDLT